MEKVVAGITQSLQKNGFPEKKVSLPFQAVFKSCKENQTSLTAVLKALEMQGILHQISGDRILFRHQSHAPAEPMPAPEIPEDLYAMAMNRIKDLDPATLQALEKKVMAMSPAERQAMLEEAKKIFEKSTRKPGPADSGS